MTEIKWVVGVYAVIGAGIGIIGALGQGLAGSGGGGGGFAGAFIGALIAGMVITSLGSIGPIISAILGLQVADRLREEYDDIRHRKVLAAVGVSNGVGFLVMALIGGVLIGAVAGGGLGTILISSIIGAAPVGLVAVGAVYVRDNYGTPPAARPVPQGAGGRGPPEGRQPPEDNQPPQGGQGSGGPQSPR